MRTPFAPSVANRLVRYAKQARAASLLPIVRDGSFMKDKLDTIIGPSLRRIIDNDRPLGTRGTLELDNAGGHGSRAVIKEYEELMKTKYKIDIKWQPANSPDSNALDLGVWMSLQSDVSKLSRRTQAFLEALNTRVMQSWSEYDGDRMLPVFDKIKDVAEAAIEMQGDNCTVAAKERARERFKSFYRRDMRRKLDVERWRRLRRPMR